MVSLGISSNKDAVTRDVKNISFVLFFQLNILKIQKENLVYFSMEQSVSLKKSGQTKKWQS